MSDPAAFPRYPADMTLRDRRLNHAKTLATVEFDPVILRGRASEPRYDLEVVVQWWGPGPAKGEVEGQMTVSANFLPRLQPSDGRVPILQRGAQFSWVAGSIPLEAVPLLLEHTLASLVLAFSPCTPAQSGAIERVLKVNVVEQVQTAAERWGTWC